MPTPPLGSGPAVDAVHLRSLLLHLTFRAPSSGRPWHRALRGRWSGQRSCRLGQPGAGPLAPLPDHHRTHIAAFRRLAGTPTLDVDLQQQINVISGYSAIAEACFQDQVRLEPGVFCGRDGIDQVVDLCYREAADIGLLGEAAAPGEVESDVPRAVLRVSAIASHTSLISDWM